MLTKTKYADLMQEFAGIPQDCQKEAAEDIRLRWPSIFEGLINAAERGNVRAFLVLREEAWGVPFSGNKISQQTTEISLEELLSADEDGVKS